MLWDPSSSIVILRHCTIFFMCQGVWWQSHLAVKLSRKRRGLRVIFNFSKNNASEFKASFRMMCRSCRFLRLAWASNQGINPTFRAAAFRKCRRLHLPKKDEPRLAVANQLFVQPHMKQCPGIGTKTRRPVRSAAPGEHP